MLYDFIIIGAGPAGLFAAANAGGKVLLLEKMPEPGRKLLLSGSGRCNLTHQGQIEDFLPFYGKNGNFLRPAFRCLDNLQLMHFFEQRGIGFRGDENGKLFPEGGSEAVLKVLLEECRKKQVRIACSERVEKVEKRGMAFSVRTGNIYESKAVLITTGGKSYPGTGSTGDGYGLAAGLGHDIIEPRPALAPIYVKEYPFSGLSGISFQDCGASLWRSGRKIGITHADFMFTHRNLSGPAVMTLSAQALPGDELQLCFLPPDQEKRFNCEFFESVRAAGKKQLKSVLRESALPARLVEVIFSRLGIDQDFKAADASNKLLESLLNSITRYSLTVEKTGGFNEAMVTAGGVSLKEIDPNSMQSKIVLGLYFAGEVLDLDGDCGGYNLQAAFSTAALAVKANC
ncbi:MAG: NAD(P)/FAD-dependent oxidoreductase [Candidatus Wallbacteria bacterium]|nr:NAD(P)/FAD-dependent oxidoreductase [Candidatus Wallbacteria bacterium]